MTQNRFKSKVFWAGILAIVMLVASQFGLYEKIGITSQFVQTLFDLIWVAIASVSVGNNPSNKFSW